MKIFTAILAAAAAGFVLGATEIVPQVSDKGVMTLSCSGRTVIQSGNIIMNGTNGKVISDISKAQLTTFRNRNRIRNVWASDIFELQRLITSMPDGSVKIEWSGKFLRGDQLARSISVVWFTPVVDSNFKTPGTLVLEDVELKLDFTEGLKPVVRDVTRSRVDNEGSYITLEWKYDPAKVNDLRSTLIISAPEPKNKK